MALYTYKTQEEVARMLNSPKYNPNSTIMYNELGRDAGSQATNSGGDNFFTKKAHSIGNTVGTTISAPVSLVRDIGENIATYKFQGDSKSRMNDVAKKYGYNTYHDIWDARDKAEAEGDTATLDFIDNTINPELQAQANANAKEATDRAKGYEDYRKNNLISKNINQDNAKYLGSAINTLSTGFDVMSMAAGIPNGPVSNAVQGAVEGFADELERNGGNVDIFSGEAKNWDNFDIGRAGQNAAIGAAAGAATGALNKLAPVKNFGDGKISQAVLNSSLGNKMLNNAVGRGIRAVGTGAARGALSGAVGGAVGSGLSSAMNGVELGQGIANTLQGAGEGAKSGAVTGGVMAGANLAANAALNRVAPKTMEKVRANQARNASYGDNTIDQFKGAWNSGDSAVAENILKPVVNNVDNFVDSTRTRIVNRNAIGRLTSALDRAMDGGTRGNTKFVRLGNDLLDDLNNIRVENGLDPLTNRQVTAYENAINNNLINRVKEGMSTSDVALMAFNALTSDNSKAVPGYYNNQLVVSEPGMVNDYDGTVLGLAEDGGTSLKSIEPRNKSQIEMFEENGQQKMGPRSQFGSSPVKEQPVNNSIVPHTRENVNSQWDTIAQEAGYQTYDDAIRAFAQANPNANINAGAVLTWMDNNPGEWNPNMPKSLPKNNVTIEAEVESDLVPSKASRESKLRYAEGKELLKQYGSVDQPMARATKAAESLQELANMGFTKPGDVEKISNAITGANGTVSKLNDSVIASAKPVNTFDGEHSGQTIDDFIDYRIEKNYLSGTNEGKALKRGLNAYLNSLPSRAEGSIGFEDSAIDTFRMVQQLEASAAELEGRGGSTYHRPTTSDLHQAAVIKDVANLFKERIYDGADVQSALTPAVVANLKSYDPENKAWLNTVDNFVSTAKSPKDLRAFQRPFVRASRYIDNQYTQAATVGGRMASSAGELPDILPTTKAGILRQAVNSVWNSAPAHRAKAKLYGKLANNASQNSTATTASTIPATEAVTTPMNTASATNAYNPATQIYNMIGRDTGERQGEEQRVAQYLTEAQKDQTIAGNTLEGLVAPLGASTLSTGGASTSVYNSVYGTPATTMSYEEERAKYFYPPTGDYWTDMISQAMRNAKNAEDYDALGSLYEMYMDAVKQTSSEKDYSDPKNWSSADRKQLLQAENGLSQIDALEQSYINAVGDGGNAVQGTLRQWANNISAGNLDPAADSYVKQANSIGAGLIKNLVNLGSTEHDAQRYIEYLPKITDTKEQAAQKLQDLRNAYYSVIENLKAVYNA